MHETNLMSILNYYKMRHINLFFQLISTQFVRTLLRKRCCHWLNIMKHHDETSVNFPSFILILYKQCKLNNF